MISYDAVIKEGKIVHLTFMADIKPIDWDKAFEQEAWMDAMKEEINSIERNQTCELVNLPKVKQPIGVKLIFKL